MNRGIHSRTRSFQLAEGFGYLPIERLRTPHGRLDDRREHSLPGGIKPALTEVDNRGTNLSTESQLSLRGDTPPFFPVTIRNLPAKPREEASKMAGIPANSSGSVVQRRRWIQLQSGLQSMLQTVFLKASAFGDARR